MAAELILETTFLSDLERERLAAHPGACAAFLRAQGAARLYISHVTAGELACGAASSDRGRWEHLVLPFQILDHTADVDWCYAQSFRYLRRRGELIAANDLWIAATALAYRMPVVTRNIAHFERVPGLDVLGY